MEKNYEKQKRYAALKQKLSRAIKNEFWFEALMIEYAIIENRTSSILWYANISKNAYDSSKMLGNKLNSIEHQIGKEHPIISKKVSLDLIKDIKDWKEERNNFVHRGCNCYDEEKAAEVAKKGKALTTRIENDSAKVTRAVQRMEGTK